MTTSFDFFNYLNNELYCEDVKVKDIVEKVGSPAYIYSKNSILEHFIEIRTAFAGVDPLICFSVKANSNLSVIKVLGVKNYIKQFKSHGSTSPQSVKRQISAWEKKLKKQMA